MHNNWDLTVSFEFIDYNLLLRIRSDVYNESENCHILLCFRVYSDKKIKNWPNSRKNICASYYYLVYLQQI